MPSAPISFVIPALFSCLVLSACTANSITQQPGRITADTAEYFGATVTSWADLTAEEVGFTVPLSLIKRAPTALAKNADPFVPDPKHSVRLKLPPEVMDRTFLNHIELDYNPVGHEPAGIYTLPHFDFHFYGVTGDEQAAIDCKDTTPVPADRLPPNHLLGKPGLPPEGECIPRMGIHAVDLASPELNPQAPATFLKTMILGYYGGKIAFIEPMITREQLLKEESFTLPVPHPPVVGRPTLYPTKFTARYDKEAQAYQFFLSEFIEVR